MKFLNWKESKEAWWGALKLPTSGYLGGKEGWLPNITDWQIPGKKSSYYPTGKATLGELYSPEGMRKGGEFQRKWLTGRAGGYLEGVTGTGGTPAGKGTPEQSAWDKFKDMLDSGSQFIDAGTERIEKPFGDWSPQDWLDSQMNKMPKPSDIIPEGGLITIPPLDLTPVREGMSDFAMALAMGLGSLGQGIGGGIPQMPGMPSIQLVGEEGEPNILLLGGLAAVAYIVLKKVK